MPAMFIIFFSGSAAADVRVISIRFGDEGLIFRDFKGGAKLGLLSLEATVLRLHRVWS